jgi:hypothetical protein
MGHGQLIVDQLPLPIFLNFVDCVKHGKTPKSNIDNGRTVVIAVDLALQAMRKGTIEFWKSEYNG